MNDIVISVKNVNKRYQVFKNPKAQLMRAIWPGKQGDSEEVWALKDINFEIKRGEAVAIIGRNGGGKSTLLEIITGTLTPTSGEVEVNGRVSALLELGSGFNPEYTGRDNVILNGLLLGLSRKEILRRFDEIIEFSEIGDALDRTVKTYSSGMMMRLAFAVQVLCEPEILIIDEALSVGDFFFQQKCLSHIRKLCEKGMTLLFVSHDMGTVRDICSRAIYLKAGGLEFAGDAITSIRHYMAEKNQGADTTISNVAYEEPNVDVIEKSVKTQELETVLKDSIWTVSPNVSKKEKGCLIAVVFYDENNQATTSFRMGSALRIQIAYYPSIKIQSHIAVIIQNKYGQVVTSLSSLGLKLAPPKCRSGQVVIFEMTINLSLEAGNYTIMVSLGNPIKNNQGENLDSSPLLGPISIQWNYEQDGAPFLGMVGLPATGKFIIGAT